MVIVTFIRRLLILLCIIGILCCLVMWMLADPRGKDNGTENTLGVLKIYTRSEEESVKLVARLKSTKYKGKAKTEDSSKERVKGYIVVGNFTNEVAKPVSDYLRNNNYSVTVKDARDRQGWSKCQVGKTFSSKSQAETVARKIKSDLAVAFKAEPLMEKVPIKLYLLEIVEIDEKSATELQEKFKGQALDMVWEAGQ